jgi:DNA-directed RNA polymerase specialized sigma24 family protein
MLGATKNVEQQPTPYATEADFCRIFTNNMTPLYLLSFLLTGDHALAEKCFVGGLEDVGKGNRVFKEWAESWARRTIIQNAIQMIHPQPGQGNASAPERSAIQQFEPAEFAGIAALPDFDRFVFIISVLERYSNQECSLLLGCSRGEVIAARARALQQVGTSVQLRWKLHDSGAERKTLPDGNGSPLQLRTLSHLAITA